MSSPSPRECTPASRPGVRLAVLLGLACCCGVLAPAAWADEPAQLRFVVALPPELRPERDSGRLFVMLAAAGGGGAVREPRFGPDWFQPAPFFGRDVTGFSPGETRILDDQAEGFPDRLSRLKPGRYRFQAVFHQNLDAHSPAGGPGNLFSDVAESDLDPQFPKEIRLQLAHAVAAREFPEAPWRQQVALRSERLSNFLRRDVVEHAAVVLPRSYFDDPERRYPALYLIPGFGGSHFDALGVRQPPGADEGEVELIRVFLSGDCQWGHHVYADSATNGPRGQALVEELIPEIDRRFRTIAAPTARFVGGHSSGGWSSLWLQVNYPDAFGGVWSSSPDPVDFGDFQEIDRYAEPARNLYPAPHGGPRPIARRGTAPVLFIEGFSRMEEVLGRGGQLRSFEAVFSPLDEQGLPRQLWDRRSGAIDPVTAAAWKKYDLHLILREQWPTLGPKLAGKLHIVMGELDTFYLDGATRRLGETLRELGSDADVVIVPGMDHGSILSTPEYRRRGRQIAESFRRHHPGERAVR